HENSALSVPGDVVAPDLGVRASSDHDPAVIGEDRVSVDAGAGAQEKKDPGGPVILDDVGARRRITKGAEPDSRVRRFCDLDPGKRAVLDRVVQDAGARMADRLDAARTGLLDGVAVDDGEGVVDHEDSVRRSVPDRVANDPGKALPNHGDP